MKKLLTIITLVALSLPLMAQDLGTMMMLNSIGQYEDQYEDREVPGNRSGSERTISGEAKNEEPLDIRTRCLNLYNDHKGQYLTLKSKYEAAKEAEKQKDEAHWKNIGASALVFLGGFLLSELNQSNYTYDPSNPVAPTQHQSNQMFWNNLGTGMQYGSLAYAAINGITIAANGDKYHIEVLDLYNLSVNDMKKLIKDYEKREAPTGCEENWDMTSFTEKTDDCVVLERRMSNGSRTKRTYSEDDLLYFDDEEDLETQVLSSTQYFRYYCGEETRDCATCN